MKLSKKQKEEIDFLSSRIGDWRENLFVPSESEIEEFIAVTVYGKKPFGNSVFGGSNNRLLQAKRMLDIAVKAWQRDWGIIFFEDEIREELEHPYLDKVLSTLKTNRQRRTK